MRPGTRVIGAGVRGCRCLTEGKEYTVEDYQPAYTDPTSASGFTWPAYVGVINDDGRLAYYHTHRFKEKADGTQDLPARNPA